MTKVGGIRKIMVLWQAVFLAASPLVTAPPSNLTRLYYNGSAAKSHSTTTQYSQLRRLQWTGNLRFIFLLPSSRASRKMPRLPRLAHKAPVMQASHSNNDRHYEQKYENLPQSESESTFLKVVNALLLGLRIFNNFV